MAKTTVQIVVVWGLALGALPALAVRFDRRVGVRGLRPRRRAGAALFGVGSAVGLWAAATMVREGRGTPLPLDAAPSLVRSGPYASVRNPMASSAVAQSAGVALATGSITAMAIPVAGAVLWHTRIRPAEEAFLAELFGDAHRAYVAEVPLWLPTGRRRR